MVCWHCINTLNEPRACRCAPSAGAHFLLTACLQTQRDPFRPVNKCWPLGRYACVLGCNVSVDLSIVFLTHKIRTCLDFAVDLIRHALNLVQRKKMNLVGAINDALVLPACVPFVRCVCCHCACPLTARHATADDSAGNTSNRMHFWRGCRVRRRIPRIC